MITTIVTASVLCTVHNMHVSRCVPDEVWGMEVELCIAPHQKPQ
jgi:hypothetical protein